MSQDAASHFVTYETVGEVAHIGLNRPEKRNAISDRFVEAIADAVARAEREAKAVVLYGHGDHFCAGLDLAEHVKKTAIEGVSPIGGESLHSFGIEIQQPATGGGSTPTWRLLPGAVHIAIEENQIA